MKTMWALGAVSALAILGSAGAANAAGGNPVIDDIPGSCDIFSAPFKCHFSGNITLSNLDLVDASYNSQDPDVNPNLNLEGFVLTGSLDAPNDHTFNGSVNAGFLVDFFAVKGGDQFELYKLDGTSSTFNWSTDDLLVGNANHPNHPALSHLVWFGHAATDPCVEHPELPGCGNPNQGVPEPATWAMMVLGFMGAGTVIRRRRYSLQA